MTAQEKIDRNIAAITRPSINARAVAEGTAQGLVRELALMDDGDFARDRPWRELRNLVGAEEARILIELARSGL